MKKILALDQGEYLGGAELFFSDLLTRVAHDFEIHLITGKNATYHKLYHHSSVVLHPMDLPPLKPIGLRSFLNYRRAQKEISSLIQSIQPNKIVSNTVRTHLLASSLAKKKNIPLVWMAHDRTFSRGLMRWLKDCPQTLVSCSKFVEDYYLESLPKGVGLKTEVIYPFAIEPHQMETYKEVQKEKVIGMVGKWIPWKGQDLFLKMAQKIHPLFPEYRFELIGGVYENNPQSLEFEEKCLALAKTLNLEKIIQFKSFVPDVFAEVSRWELLIHASREPESLGRVILEGMAAGCAVVASNLGGPKEVVHNRQTGLLAPPELDALFEAVKYFLDHPEIKEQIAQRASKQVKDTYLWPKVLERFKMILGA